MPSGRRRPATSAKIFSASSVGIGWCLSPTAARSRSGTSRAAATPQRVSHERDFSARWTSPRTFRTCLTARSVTAFALALRRVVLTLPVSGPVRNSLDGLGPARHEGQHQGPVVAHDRVDAARGAPGVVAPGAGARVVGDAALEDEDLLVPEVAVAGDGRPRRVAHQDGPAVALLPEDLPVDAGPPLLPGAAGGRPRQA